MLFQKYFILTFIYGTMDIDFDLMKLLISWIKMNAYYDFKCYLIFYFVTS